MAEGLDVWGAVRDERNALLADLERLTPDQWTAPSLCSDWQVRHVVAHLIAGVEASTGALLLALLRAGLDVNRMIRDDALRRARSHTPDELISAYRDTVGSQRVPPGSRPWAMLSDTMVHGQDIRRPLGLRRAFPAERMVLALDGVVRTNAILGAARRIAGLRLRATDAEWMHGEGREVNGPAEALLLAVTGRPAGLGGLGGDGAAVLRARIAPSSS